MFQKCGFAVALLLLSFNAKSAVVLDFGHMFYADGSYVDVEFDHSTVFTTGSYELTLADVDVGAGGVIGPAEIFSTAHVSFLAGDSLSLKFTVDAFDGVMLDSLFLSDTTSLPGGVGSQFTEFDVLHGMCFSPLPCGPGDPFLPTIGLSPAIGADLFWTPVAPVPLPAAAWLFGSAMLGLAGVARRKKAQR